MEERSEFGASNHVPTIKAAGVGAKQCVGMEGSRFLK
jgi:hypothetical protein